MATFEALFEPLGQLPGLDRLGAGHEGTHAFTRSNRYRPGVLFLESHPRAEDTFPLRARILRMSHPDVGEIKAVDWSDFTTALILPDGKIVDLGDDDVPVDEAYAWVKNWDVRLELERLPCPEAELLEEALEGRGGERHWAAAAEMIARGAEAVIDRHARRSLVLAGAAAFPHYASLIESTHPDTRLFGAAGMARVGPERPATMDALLRIIREGDHWTASQAACGAVRLGCGSARLGDAIQRMDARHVSALILWVVKNVPSSAQVMRELLDHPAPSVREGAREYFAPC